MHDRWKAQASATSAMMDDMREELSVLRAEKRDWDAKEAAGRVSRAEHDSVVADLAAARSELTDLRMQRMCGQPWLAEARCRHARLAHTLPLLASAFLQ